jgi:cob(I)alamin adenosyltransferase
MSIVTKTGDQGTTALMYNRRVSKSDPRVETCGTVDELSAALGLARAAAGPGPASERLLKIQKELVALMGELATASEDSARYLRDGFPVVTPAITAGLDEDVRQLEAADVTFKGWAMPGSDAASAALDFARTVSRRAERRVCALKDAGQLRNDEILVYLNRLSDLLWLLARRAELAAAART